MKSKLRKEFEAFKVKTQQEIWELQNPLKFKFGDKLWLHSEESDEKQKCTCLGQKEVKNMSWRSNEEPWFVRHYLVKFKDGVSTLGERTLSKRKK